MRSGVRVAYQGEPGAFSEAAVLRLLPDAEPRPFPTFDEVFDAVHAGDVALGVVPIENSIGGSIHRNYDLLVEARPGHRRRSAGAGRAQPAGAAGRPARGRAARPVASAGAGAVRRLSADAEGRRGDRHLRHRGQRQDGARRRTTRHGGDRVGARGQLFGLEALQARRRGLQGQHHAVPRGRPGSGAARARPTRRPSSSR